MMPTMRESLRLSRRESKKLELEKLKLINLERKRKIYLQERAKNSNRLAVRSSTWADAYKVLRKPSGSEIVHGLPIWNVGNIDDKLVYIEPGDEEFAFSRGKAGTSLFKRVDGCEFQLDNDMELPYQPLHDPHMKYFLKYHLSSLKRKGLVTDENEVICSLKEFNYYRKYLHSVHSEAINRLAKEKDQEETETITFRRMMIKNRVFEDREERKAIRAERTKAVLAKQEAETKSKKEKCKARLDHVDSVMEQKQYAHHLANLEAEKRHHDFKMRIQKRVDAGVVIERRRKLTFMLQKRAAKKEQRVREKLKAEEKRIRRRNKIEQRWNLKVHHQTLRLEKEKNITDMRIKELKLNSEKRLDRAKYLTSKREIRLEKLKKKKKDEVEEAVRLKKLERKRFYDGEIKKEVVSSNANMPEIKFGIKGIADRLENRIQSTCPQEISDLLFMGVQKTRKEKFKLPVEVGVALTHLLNSVIERFVRKRVSEEVPQLVADIIEIYNSNLNKWANSQKLFKGGLTDEELSEINEDESFSDEDSPSTTAMEIQRIKNLPAKVKFFNSLNYLHERLIKLMKRNIRHFFETLYSGEGAEIPDLLNNDMRIINLIEYITVTLLNFAETRMDIDEDVCVTEIADFIECQILHTVEK